MTAIALVSVINYYHINGLHLFWDTLYNPLFPANVNDPSNEVLIQRCCIIQFKLLSSLRSYNFGCKNEVEFTKKETSRRKRLYDCHYLQNNDYKKILPYITAKYIKNRFIGLMGRVFANGPEDFKNGTWYLLA